MKAPNLFALIAAVLLTATSLSIVHTNVRYQPVAEIDGARVIELAPVHVVPSAEERRAASLLSEAAMAASGMVNVASMPRVTALSILILVVGVLPDEFKGPHSGQAMRVILSRKSLSNTVSPADRPAPSL